MGGLGSGSRPKVYPVEMVRSVATLYAQGLTQREVAERLGTTQKVIFNVMRRHAVPTRVARPRVGQRGERNHNWKGDGAGYQALHVRLYTSFGPASAFPCAECGLPAQDWANLTGRYADMGDYEPMCRPCHRRYDLERRQEVMRDAR